MKKNLTMQLLPLWLLAFFFFASVPIKAQTYSEATPRIGIVKMIGCGTGTEANKAQIQVIHDGTGYSYNFGANASAQSGSTAWLPAGTHTVTVTKGSRTYKLPITVPAKVAPTFTPTITYNCNGTADVRLTNNQGTYNYTYTYGGNTHNSPYFRDLAVGQHTITVKYTQPTAGRDIVFFDDFGTKETGDPKAVRSKYAISTMNFAPLNGTQVQPNGTVVTGVNLTNDACYTVATKADADTEGSPSVWLYPNDKDGKANGRYLYYDAHTVNQNLYTRKAKVKPNTPVNFSAYLFNTVKSSYNSAYTVRVTLDIYANEAAAQAGTAPLFRSYYFNVPTATTDADKWYPINVTANIGGSYSELVFVVRMYGDSLNGGIGNDIALDNVLVTQPTAICEQTLAVPVNVVTNTNTYSTTVTYNCAANNATIKVTPSVTTGYTYTYKLDNGTAGSNNTFNNVAVGVHTLTLTSQYTGAKVIFKEDFGSGAPYRLPETVVPKPFVCKDVLYGYPADILPEGHYQVANVNNLTQMNTWNWRSPKDHTNSTDGQGRYLAFNHGANANKPFYKQDNIRVEANKPVTVEYYAYNINKNSTVDLPKIKVKLVNKATNAVVHTSSTYAVTGNTSDTDWRKVTFTFTPPVNARDLELNFINEENSEGSNDFAIDDILVTQAYEVCATTVTATVAPKVTQAFAGVTRLIGCGTGANANKAEVTITNVQGGTGAYEYNFDGTWVATNTGWLPAGTHTVSVRAKGTGNSCQYDMSVTVLAAIAQPTIKTEVFYACDGKAILNVGVENPDPELTYMYSLDGGAYTTTYVYTNVASGTHSISVQYEHRSVPSPSLLFREDFGNGNPTPLPGPASDYGLTYGTTYPIGAGFYQIVSQDDAPSYWALLTPFNTCAVRSGNLSDRWVSVYDHTSGGTDATGRFYMSDFRGTQADGDLFYKREVNVLPGADINYEFYALNLFRQDRTTSPWSPNPEALKPNVVVRLVAPDGTVVASTTTGEIPNSVCATNLADNLKNWRKYEGKLNVGTYTKLTVEIRSAGSALHGWGNDMALDDITVNMIPKSCGQVISATKVVTANAHDIPAFTVSKTYDCATGKGVLTVTPTATTGFTYTYTLGSTTYTSTTATFTGLDLEQTYTVSVSYQAVSNTITLLNEDFGVGTDPVKSPYVGKNLYFNENKLSAYTAYNGNKQSINHLANTALMAGEYTIASNMVKPSYDWVVPADRSGKANGRKLFIDGTVSVPEQEIYTREVSIAPNLPLTFTTDFYNLVHNPSVPSANNPRVNIALYESEASYKNGSGPLAQSTIEELLSVGNQWKTHTLTLTAANVGARTRIYAVVKMHNVIDSGHDLTIDNIVITQKLPACTTSVTATLTKGDVATPTLTLPANLSVICSAPTASATISSWIASATATSTCGTATVTHNYNYPSNLCNVTGGAVTVTFSTTDPFGNVVSGTRVITFATMTLTVTPTALTVPNGITGGTTSSVVPNITLGGVASPSTNSVTITFSGLPTGVTSTTGGRLIVAPNTPAGSHTITYRVCETAGHNNCKTVNTQLVIGTGSLTVTPVTPLTVPNGANGGTTSSVLTGVRLNGNVVTNTNSVTISFSGLPTGVTSNTNGQLVIPAGTPAGTHTITYKVCEKLNPTNCQTVTSTLVIGTGSLTVTSTTLTHPNGTQGGTTTGTVLTGVKINGNPVNTASVTITWNSLPPNATGNASGTVTIAPNTPAGTYTISYTVCERLNGNSNCQSVTSQITIGGGNMTVTPTNLTHPNGTQGGTTTGTVLTGVKINGNPVNTASVTITWNSLPPNATGNASGTVTIAPNTPAGTYTISYTVCERLNGNSNCQSVTSQITIGGGSLTATPTTLTYPNGTQGGTTTGTVLTGVKINGNPVNTASVTITWNSLPPNATGNASGTVTIAPNTPAGTYTISYTVCERLNGNSNCQSVTSQITIGGGSLTATPTQLIVANGATGGTSVNNVLTGVTINGNPVNTNSVTITWNSLPPGFTGTNSGTVTVPANTPAGTYTVSYTVCERLNQNNNCKTVTSTITVGNGNMIVVPTPITVPNGTIGGTSTPSVLTGVVLNGNSNPAPNTVSITWNTLPPRATGNNDGTVNVAPNTPAGTYTVSYTICEALNSGHCTTVTSTITIGGGVLTVTPVTTLTVANGAQGGTTTSSVLTGVSLNGQPANSQSVTITFTGLPAGVTSNTNGQLVVAPGTPATNTTIYYTVCETLNANNNCHTYSTTLVIGTPNLSVTPRTYTIPDATVGGTTSSVLETVTIDGHTPSSQSVTITFGNLPVGIQTTTSGGFRVPAGTPTGIHTVTYTVCEVLNPDHCVTSIATIAVGNVPVVTPNAFTYTGTATVTTPSILDDDTVGTQSATTGTGGNVVINITSTPTGTVVPSLDANNGRVTIPAGTPPGIYTITYDVCTTATPTACTPGAVVITIPNVPVITPDDMVYTDTTTTTVGNILTNDRVGTQSATAGNGGNVSITVTIPATPKAPGATVPTLNSNTGVVTVPAGTPSGTYTITYKICTTATPTSCDTGVVTITVSGTVTDAPDTNDVTAYTRINTPVTVGVTSSTTVTVSIPSQPANGTAVSNGDGTITYTPNNGFKGTDSFEYSLCNAAGCRTATISVRVTSELIIYNGVSIGGSDKNNHFHIEGIENYPNNTVRIYNRWGVKVFEMSGYNNTTKAFRGVSDARATLEASDNLPQGTYYYIIEYVDEHNKTQTETGWLYLKKN